MHDRKVLHPSPYNIHESVPVHPSGTGTAPLGHISYLDYLHTMLLSIHEYAHEYLQESLLYGALFNNTSHEYTECTDCSGRYHPVAVSLSLTTLRPILRSLGSCPDGHATTSSTLTTFSPFGPFYTKQITSEEAPRSAHNFRK